MIEELKEEKLIEKVGGRFRLSSLIQKRLVFLNKGSAPYVEADGKKDKLQIVIQEILEDKIYLNMDDELVENPSGLPVDADAAALAAGGAQANPFDGMFAQDDSQAKLSDLLAQGGSANGDFFAQENADSESVFVREEMAAFSSDFESSQEAGYDSEND